MPGASTTKKMNIMGLYMVGILRNCQTFFQFYFASLQVAYTRSLSFLLSLTINAASSVKAGRIADIMKIY